MCASRLICRGACNRHRSMLQDRYCAPTSNFCETGGFVHIDRENTMRVRRSRGLSLRGQSRSPWHGKCSRALIESFVQNRTQLLQSVIQSGTMSSRPDTSLFRSTCARVHRSQCMRDLISRPGAKCKLKFPHIIGPLKTLTYLRIARGRAN